MAQRRSRSYGGSRRSSRPLEIAGSHKAGVGTAAARRPQERHPSRLPASAESQRTHHYHWQMSMWQGYGQWSGRIAARGWCSCTPVITRSNLSEQTHQSQAKADCLRPCAQHNPPILPFTGLHLSPAGDPGIWSTNLGVRRIKQRRTNSNPTIAFGTGVVLRVEILPRPTGQIAATRRRA